MMMKHRRISYCAIERLSAARIEDSTNVFERTKNGVLLSGVFERMDSRRMQSAKISDERLENAC